MASAVERANMGYDEGRMGGKGAVGSTVEAAKAATGRGGYNNMGNNSEFNNTGYNNTGNNSEFNNTGYNNMGIDQHSGLENRGLMDRERAYKGDNDLGRTGEELARLQNRTVITGESEAYAPNPNIEGLPKEFETRLQVVQKYPEMKTVEKTDIVKEVRNEERVITVPKTRVVVEDVERIDRVPVVREVPKTRMETVHRVVTEEREVTDMVPVVEYNEVPRVEQVPKVITEEIEDRVTVPVVVEVPVTRQVEVPTGNFCEAPVEQVVNPGHGGMLGHGLGHGLGHEGVHTGHSMHTQTEGGVLHRNGSSSSSSDDEADVTAAPVMNPDGSSYVAPQKPKKKGLMSKIFHH